VRSHGSSPEPTISRRNWAIQRN